jgi:hypothetical protein
MVNKDVISTLTVESKPSDVEKRQIESTSPNTVEERDRKISFLNNVLRDITSLDDVEKQFPGIKDFYAKLLSDRRKRRNLKKKQAKALKSIKDQKNLDVKSKDFTSEFLKIHKIELKDIHKPLIDVQNKSGDELVSANFYNRGVIEESIYIRAHKSSSGQ